MNNSLEQLTHDDANWRNLLSFSSHPTSSDDEQDVHERAHELAQLVKQNKELTGYIVGEIFGQSFSNPSQIDRILSTYNATAEEFNGDESYTDYGFTGKEAILKALDAELLEMLQTPGEPIVGRGPYDVSCPISPTEDAGEAARRVLQYATARYKWIITHAISARQSVLTYRAGGEADQRNFEFSSSVVEKALGIDTSRGEPDKTDFLNGMITLLISGKLLYAFGPGQRTNAIVTRLQVALKNERNFRLKYFIAAALDEIDGSIGWSSEKLFDPSTWVM